MLKCQVIGHLGGNAEIKTLDSGARVIEFSVAHSEKFKSKQGDLKEKTIWVRVSQWLTDKDTGKVAEYLTKGKLVYVEGAIEARGFEKNGEVKASLEMRAMRIELLSKGEDGGTAAAPAQSGWADSVDPENLPF